MQKKQATQWATLKFPLRSVSFVQLMTTVKDTELTMHNKQNPKVKKTTMKNRKTLMTKKALSVTERQMAKPVLEMLQIVTKNQSVKKVLQVTEKTISLRVTQLATWMAMMTP